MLASNKMAPNSRTDLKKTFRALGAKAIATVHYFIVFFVVFGSFAPLEEIPLYNNMAIMVYNPSKTNHDVRNDSCTT